MRIFTGQKPDDGWSNLDVAVWTVVAFVVAALLLIPSVATAQEPTRVCTQLAVHEDSLLADHDALRGEPPDGECDVIVYLPLVLVDSRILGSLQVAAEEETAHQSEVERLAAMTCEELNEVRNNFLKETLGGPGSEGRRLAGAMIEEKRCDDS